jgi:hypothetical protein
MTHWTHMEVMEWFSSIICCGMSSKGNSFGWESVAEEI